MNIDPTHLIKHTESFTDAEFRVFILHLLRVKGVITSGKIREAAKLYRIDTMVTRKVPAYKDCVEHWLTEVHPDFCFGAVHGKSMKEIIKKLDNLPDRKPDLSTLDLFKVFCQRLPSYYKGKDLPLLNSKFNEIIFEIKNGVTKGSVTDSYTMIQ